MPIRLLLTLLLLINLVPAFAESVPNYRLGTGDVVSIQVFGEEDLKLEVRLRDSGQISYPFLGEMRVAGKSVQELENMITQGLRDGYLVDPKVTVSIKEYRPFYVNGEVKKPGGYPYTPELTVRKAVSLAGGLTERASEKKIFLIRENDPGRNSVRVELNDRVRPGDILTVEESFF